MELKQASSEFLAALRVLFGIQSEESKAAGGDILLLRIVPVALGCMLSVLVYVGVQIQQIFGRVVPNWLSFVPSESLPDIAATSVLVGWLFFPRLCIEGYLRLRRGVFPISLPVLLQLVYFIVVALLLAYFGNGIIDQICQLLVNEIVWLIIGFLFVTCLGSYYCA